MGILLVAAASLAPLAAGQRATPAPAPGTEPPRTPQAAETGFPTPEVGVLYDRLTRIRRDYQAAIEQLLDGESRWAIEALSAASDALRAAADDCARTGGCDLGRFLDTFDDLARAQTVALQREQGRLAAATALPETEEAQRAPSGQSRFDSTLREIAETASLLRGTELSSLITLNGPVKAALDDWLTWMRPVLMDSYENYQFLRNQMAPIYEAAELPEALLFAMIATESRGRVHSFSRAGAAGPLQFMRATGRAYGLREVDGFDTRLDPTAATRANVAYLNAQFKVLNNDLEKALAAYNGGEGRVRGLHRRHKGANLWDSRFYYALPRETREYVPRVLAAAYLFLHPDEYNLQWPAYQIETTEIALVRDASLGELAICLGQEHNRNGWFRTLRNLNPRVEANARLEAGERVRIPVILARLYREQCTSGPLLTRAQALYEANYPDGSDLVPYVVRSGDTIGRIASRLSCISTGELADMNGLRPPRFLIRIGQRLRIPSC